MVKWHHSGIIKDNIELVDGKSIADAFNDFFANIGSKLANSIPPATKSPLSYLPAEKPNSFYLLPVTSNEIEEVISTLNVKLEKLVVHSVFQRNCWNVWNALYLNH